MVINKVLGDQYLFSFSIENDLKKAINLKPKHLSFYSLILEDNTILKINGYKEEDEDIEEELTLEELDQLRDEDFEEHGDFLEEEAELDEQTLKRLIGED